MATLPSGASIFAPHGNLEIVVEGRMLIVHRTGPFNLEYARAALEKIGPIEEELSAGGAYVRLTVYHESALNSIEAVDAVIERAATIDSNKSNCIGMAIVVGPDVEGRHVMLPHFKRFFKARQFPADKGRIFDALEPAMEFLENILAGVAG